ncbi:enoyl-CoA hydratase [Gordonia jinghuaiqii]|uniref:Enoyl-CoA hydratase/isomerase family protein n=1 Tax=Gordonia jinghuaiqii TaxID=2758710 RepID=A0A7D7LZ19_9ACTN|nr:enoyl-CoA hydratase-related protein [Gordonia jinghuaiqii]MCR5977596.1 enoyl-CoA hydratase [Gordonia jinghuaiqii]QMT02274.1 enoyl-CoA hydratase/isomerase family protein [Gordonia jinghuaiqii]
MTSDTSAVGRKATQDEPTITVERDGEIAIFRLNRPDRLNAFTVQMGEELRAAFDETDADDTVRAVVLTGTGRAFCAGADLEAGGSTFDASSSAPGAERAGRETTVESDEIPADEGGKLTLRMFASLKPIVVAVNGPSAGVGVTMTLPADVRIASEDAKFGFVFAARGLVPEAASSWFLPRLVGLPTALQWTIGAKMVPVAEAHERGLIQQVVPKDKVVETAIAVAREMTANSAPVSAALTRQLLWRMAGAPSPLDAHHADSRAIFHRGQSGDTYEGVMSFLEKRPATYPNTVSADLPDIFDDQP